jgi:hypothetical protein
MLPILRNLHAEVGRHLVAAPRSRSRRRFRVSHCASTRLTRRTSEGFGESRPAAYAKVSLLKIVDAR